MPGLNEAITLGNKIAGAVKQTYRAGKSAIDRAPRDKAKLYKPQKKKNNNGNENSFIKGFMQGLKR